jgi:hypothetical protein
MFKALTARPLALGQAAFLRHQPERHRTRRLLPVRCSVISQTQHDRGLYCAAGHCRLLVRVSGPFEPEGISGSHKCESNCSPVSAQWSPSKPTKLIALSVGMATCGRSAPLAYVLLAPTRDRPSAATSFWRVPGPSPRPRARASDGTRRSHLDADADDRVTHRTPPPAPLPDRHRSKL